jgi:hypothetical protein
VRLPHILHHQRGLVVYRGNRLCIKQQTIGDAISMEIMISATKSWDNNRHKLNAEAPLPAGFIATLKALASQLRR